MKVLGIAIGGFIAAVLLVLVIGSKTGIPDASQPSLWKVVGRVPDKLKPIFVELDQTAVARREIYDEAVRALCGSGSCKVMFLAAGDPTPPSSSFKAFLDFGGFGVRHLATWSDGEFTQWDCERAGVNGAPLGALCGAGVSEAYSAILALSIHAGMRKACEWPLTDDVRIVGDYISRMSDKLRQEQFRNTFVKIYDGGNRRPDNLRECDNVQKRNAAELLEARKLLTAR
jgi:hypothetical protein